MDAFSLQSLARVSLVPEATEPIMEPVHRASPFEFEVTVLSGSIRYGTSLDEPASIFPIDPAQPVDDWVIASE